MKCVYCGNLNDLMRWRYDTGNSVLVCKSCSISKEHKKYTRKRNMALVRSMLEK